MRTSDEKPLFITRAFTFDAAHRLTFHKGKCKNIHGHTWKCEVSIRETEETQNNMILDFGDLKKACQAIADKFDHKLLIWEHDLDLTDTVGTLHLRTDTLKVGFETTVENLCYYVKDLFNLYLPNGVQVHKIKLWETPNNSCTLEA